MLFLSKVKISNLTMTRYITRSKYTEDSSVKDTISNTIKKYGIKNCEKCSEEMKKIINCYLEVDRLVNFIENFYKYREFLSYNSRVYIIKLYISNNTCDLVNMRINGKRLYGVNNSTIYTQIPLVVLLSNDDTITPIPISTIYFHNEYYNYCNDDCYNCSSDVNFNTYNRIYDIYSYDIGSNLFYCDYMFYDVNNTIYDYSYVNTNGTSYVNSGIKIPTGLIDFISVNKPSLEHYAIDRRKFYKYKMPKFIEYIRTNINSIVSENSPPELVKIFNELTSHEDFEPKYISFTQIKKEQARKRIQELEQELNKLKNIIDD